MKGVNVITIEKVSPRIYRLLGPKGNDLTGVQTFDSDAEAIGWAMLWIGSWEDYVLDSEIKKDGDKDGRD